VCVCVWVCVLSAECCGRLHPAVRVGWVDSKGADPAWGTWGGLKDSSHLVSCRQESCFPLVPGTLSLALVVCVVTTCLTDRAVSFPGDIYVHADLHGATSCVIKNPTGTFCGADWGACISLRTQHCMSESGLASSFPPHCSTEFQQVFQLGHERHQSLQDQVVIT